MTEEQVHDFISNFKKKESDLAQASHLQLSPFHCLRCSCACLVVGCFEAERTNRDLQKGMEKEMQTNRRLRAERDVRQTSVSTH